MCLSRKLRRALIGCGEGVPNSEGGGTPLPVDGGDLSLPRAWSEQLEAHPHGGDEIRFRLVPRAAATQPQLSTTVLLRTGGVSRDDPVHRQSSRRRASALVGLVSTHPSLEHGELSGGLRVGRFDQGGRGGPFRTG